MTTSDFDDGPRSIETTLRIRALETSLAKGRLIASRDELAKRLDAMRTIVAILGEDGVRFKPLAGLSVVVLTEAVDAVNNAIAQAQYLGSIIKRIPSEDN